MEKLEESKKNEIICKVDHENWVMRINDDGIFFNREKYPNSGPDDFAQAVIDVLEKEFTVKFEKKNPPYNRSV